jgi:serine/tyrosine/threonine adenylyltransferase
LYADWFATVAERTAVLMAHWMRVGFVHGVMNTDNLSILGLTIDYGPYGWIDNFDPDWTPNTTDAGGRRYRFSWQPKIAYWNLTMLAHAISPLFGEDVAPLNAGLQRFMDAYVAADRATIAGKLGLREARDSDIENHQMLQDLLRVGEVDMTLFYRALSRFDPDADIDAQLDGPGDLFAHAYYNPTYREEALPGFWDWFNLYAPRLREEGRPAEERRASMDAVNPKYVLRNYLAQEAIDLAEQGDDSRVVELLDVMRKPYDEQPQYERFAQKRPEWAKTKVGCSMLSCSS